MGIQSTASQDWPLLHSLRLLVSNSLPTKQCGLLQQGSCDIPTGTDLLGRTRLVADIRMPVFNIITGGEPMSVDTARFWNGQRLDYRRRR